MLHANAVRASTVISRSILITVCFVAGALAGEPATADPVQFDIEEQPLRDALAEFARQSDREILYSTEAVEGKDAPLIAGEYVPEDALELLLADTELEYSVTPNDTILVAEEEGGADSGNVRTTSTLAMIAQASVEQNQRSQRTETDSTQGESKKSEKKRPLDEIVVIGTSIRGIAPASSPTQTFTREDILITGAATAQDFIQTLPINFGGGSNIATLRGGLPNDDSSRFNDPFKGGAGGSSVNLRGLGSGATLVLLNGHRLAPSSGIGDFVDISMIPASALERVEILTDGASSIYGGDAVAGVVNFILRDDFEGAETSLRYGTVTEGDLDQYRANLTGGKAWDAGNALFVYEYFSQDDLSAGDRSFSQNAALPNDLLPKQERHSALVSASQEVTPDLKLFGDVLFSQRKTASDSTLFENYARSTSKSDSWNISAGGSWAIDDNWVLDTFGTYSNAQTDSRWESMMGSVPRTVDSTMWAVDATVSGAVLQLTGGDLKVAFGGHYRSGEFSNQLLADTGISVQETEYQADRDTYAFFAEAYVPIVGPDNAMPGIARLEINASGRFDHYSDFGSTANPKVGVLWSPFEGLNLRGSYSTSFNPPPLGRAGAADRSLLVYPSLVINSLLGLTPGDPSIADVDMILVNGTSNNLEAEESRAFSAGVDFNQQWGNDRLSVRATYFDIEFDGRLGKTPVPDGSPSFNVPNIAFDQPELFPEGTVIFFPTLDQLNDVINSADLPVIPAFGAGDPLNASVINFSSVIRNLSLTVVRGIDFGATYSLESESEKRTFLLGLTGTYFIDFEQQATVVSPIVGQLNTLFNPVDLTLRGHAGYTNNGGFRANLFLNYKTDYRSDNTPGALRIDSWTTVDLTVAYDTRQKFGDSVFNDTVFRLSVNNLFDNDPPSVPSDISYSFFGYDPTNASPLGRFVAVELTKGF